jgi:hypothetical protein
MHPLSILHVFLTLFTHWYFRKNQFLSHRPHSVLINAIFFNIPSTEALPHLSATSCRDISSVYTFEPPRTLRPWTSTWTTRLSMLSTTCCFSSEHAFHLRLLPARIPYTPWYLPPNKLWRSSWPIPFSRSPRTSSTSKLQLHPRWRSSSHCLPMRSAAGPCTFWSSRRVVNGLVYT